VFNNMANETEPVGSNAFGCQFDGGMLVDVLLMARPFDNSSLSLYLRHFKSQSTLSNFQPRCEVLDTDILIGGLIPRRDELFYQARTNST
jgi:hypothetical protein